MKQQTICRVISALTWLHLVSCNSENKSSDSRATTAAEEPLPFDRARFSSVTPMLDGTAYAKTSDGRLWHVRGSEAVLVKSLAGASVKLPKFSEITAVLDGSAYARARDEGSGLWYFHAANAEKVVEVASLADAAPPGKISEKAFYALYLSEHKKRKDAEERADEAEYRADEAEQRAGNSGDVSDADDPRP
jgi:hypothetical protein